jgi:hypothetical protein
MTLLLTGLAAHFAVRLIAKHIKVSVKIKVNCREGNLKGNLAPERKSLNLRGDPGARVNFLAAKTDGLHGTLARAGR